ncbi:MAG: SufD family Fe-S cluster assembly protein, partial [Fidelibacterota bacterium]
MAGSTLNPNRVAQALSAMGTVDPSRQAALAAIQEKGFPSARHEDWRHNRQIPFQRQALGVNPKPSATVDWSQSPFSQFNRLAIVDGYPENREGEPIAPLIPDRPLPQPKVGVSTPFFDLNTALCPETMHLEIPAHTRGIKPIYLPVTDIESPFLTNPRLNLALNSGSEATLLWHNLSGPKPATPRNGVLSIQLKENAHLTLVSIDETDPGDSRLSTVVISQEDHSVLNWTHLSLARGQTRMDVLANLTGEGAELTLNALGLLSGKAEADIHSVITHASPATASREVVKNVLTQNAHGIFNGRVVVAPHAIKTDSQQS